MHISNNKINNNPFIESICSAFEGIAFNVLINTYALENVVMGFISPNERIPLDKYIRELNIQNLNPYLHKNACLDGLFIGADGKIVDVEKDRLLYEYYLTNVHRLFRKIMKDKYDNELLPCNINFRSYFYNAFELFKQVACIDVEYGFADIVPDICDSAKYFDVISKFVVAIKLNGLRQGKCVNRYLKNIKTLPYAVKNLVKIKNNKYVLAKDSDSIEYKLALFSVFSFLNAENHKIFGLKIKRWYELDCRI